MIKEKLDHVVILFAGDSGDGIQLTGKQFSDTSALMGNDIATFPDYPSEIRAPSGTVYGVSGFQVHIGAKELFTPGDQPDVLVALNPAALKAKLGTVRKGGLVIINDDAFTKSSIKKAGYENGFQWNEIENHGFRLIHTRMTTQVEELLKDSSLDPKTKKKCKNFYALGLCYFIFSRDIRPTLEWIDKSFQDKGLAEANKKALEYGFHFGETIEAAISTYQIPKADIKKGTYRQINGNKGVAWGLMQAAENMGYELFLGSYPITPASEILQELSKHKNYPVVTFQAEDEIAGICSAIGASFGGALAATTTSGPGFSLKSEALNLAVMLELPLVVVDVQRAGPSTGLPTKTEQSDLLQAFFGRNGESPLIVLAASRPNDCFEMAYEASRLAVEHMTPVVLLSDGYLANGSEPWLISGLDSRLKPIRPKTWPGPNGESVFNPYKRDEQLVRDWVAAGTPEATHRVGGLEKDSETGNVSYGPMNHERMVKIRQEKVNKVVKNIPDQEIDGPETGKLLVVSWGSTYGAIHSAVKEMRTHGHELSHVHLKYLNPFPRNLGDILSKFDKILVPEKNNGQLVFILNGIFQCHAKSHTKIQGRPFYIDELTAVFTKELNN
jgi:2-oxoglutarate ferredoxin oxidoreductase subunit alpha